jgi:DNA modification methylase
MKDLIAKGVKVQTCVTSPPYFGLRDYGTAQWSGGSDNCDHKEYLGGRGESSKKQNTNVGTQKYNYKDLCKKCGAKRIDLQIGLEENPQAYVDKMVEVFRCVRDLLADDGTLWLNLGDSYAGSGKGPAGNLGKTHNERHLEHKHSKIVPDGCKPKDLIGIPWLVALALRADGWYLRQDIIWAKPNPMPESVMDRCTKSHEYIFLMSKNPHYYFDHEAIREPAKSESRIARFGGNKYGDSDDPKHASGNDYIYTGTRNKRSVWTQCTKPYKGAHFATFPTQLIEPCVLAGSRINDIVFDPFMGSGTTAEVAIMNDRQYLGCELNPEYQKLQNERIARAYGTRKARLPIG